MISDDLEKLRHWIATNASRTKPGEYDWNARDQSQQSLNELRNILGSIMKSVNEASAIFKTAARSPTPEIAARAKSVIDEIENYPAIKSTISVVKPMLLNDGAFDSKAVLHIIHYLERASFTEAQKERLREVANFQQAKSSDFPDEINQAGLDNVLKNSIYNLSNGSEKTLKVIREILQNAVDATDPKQHPELQSRHGFRPEIRLETHVFKEGEKNHYLDLIVEDKGVGMNWDVLSKKFFVTFDSGKAQDKGAAGGFGIAKALIQDAPEHGWAVDTNQMHSSRFHKNVFFGTRKDQEYTTPTSDVKKTADGTVLSLHGLPYTYEGEIKSLCQMYATNGRVKIFFKGEEQSPRFTMDSDEIKSIDDSAGIPDIMSKDESEKEVTERIFSKYKEEIKDKMENIGLSSNSKTSYRFYLKKAEYNGKLYVMVNGQYQFDRDKYIPKVDIICSVETTARPGEDDYPLDPGREYLRGDINKKIDELIMTIREFAQKVGEDDLFKEGIEAINVNEEAEPMTIDESESTTSKKEEMLNVLQHITGASGFKQSDEPREPDSTDRQGEPGNQGGERPQAPPQEATKDYIEKVTDELTKLAGPNNVFSRSAIKSMVADASSAESRVEQNRKIKSIIEGLSTPGQILIQKNFMARKTISENAHLVSETMILWQKAMRMIIQKVASTARYSFAKGRTFVPGVVFSDEVLGLYMPAKKDSGRNHDSVSINPVTLAAFVLPKEFQERIAQEGREKEAFEMYDDPSEKTSGNGETPTNRVAKFVFHLAVHEMCHLLYPDSRDSGSENFHKNISKMELICHDVYEELRREVKSQMPSLRKSSKRLISLIGKHKTVKEWSTVAFKKWMESKKIFAPKTPQIIAKKAEIKPAPNTFKEFLALN